MFLCTPLSAEISVNPTVDETIKQINSIPADDIWWTVNGKDMLWNFKNLNKIFPTTTIYRKGQISPLELKPDDKISQFLVKTDDGTMELKDFLDSDLSTAMGVLILHKGDIVFEHYPRMQEHEKPVYWSVTKVLVSSLVSILEDQKKIDINNPYLFEYDWPGNVRELRNLVERIAILSPNEKNENINMIINESLKKVSINKSDMY